MRKSIALAMVLAVTSVNAEELKFGDLNYFLQSGEFNLAADLNQTYDKVSVEGDDTLETRGLVVETRYGYGINDKLTAFVGLDYAWDREVEDKTTTADADYNQDGLANPEVGVLYRWKDQNSDAYNVDFGAVARINIEDAETGASVGGESNDGNFANGRNSLELNTAIGRKWNEANEWQLAGGVVYNASGDETVRDVGGDTDYDIETSYDIFLRASYQYRPVETFMTLVSLQGTRVGELERETGNTEVTDDAHIDFDLRFTAKYLVTDNFIAKFNYGNARNANYDREVANTDIEVKSRRENFFGLGVEFLF